VEALEKTVILYSLTHSDPTGPINIKEAYPLALDMLVAQWLAHPAG